MVEDIPDLFIIIFYIFNNLFKYYLFQISEIWEMFKYVFLLHKNNKNKKKSLKKPRDFKGS